MKAPIAYSSVAHMALVISSLFSHSTLGTKSAMPMMISHGLTSSSLFLLVNILYNQHHSQNTLLYKSLMSTLPNLTMWWFLFSMINILAPPSINLIII